MHFGIDYGSKMAGTTVITYDKDGILHQIASQKKQDADKLILAAAVELKPTAVYIDAPLSLPGAYFGKGNDYFYRKADKELNAMSPMFLGGLTARAMRLKKELEEKNIKVFETYPGALVRSAPILNGCYQKKDKKSVPVFLEKMEAHLYSIKTDDIISNYHQIDSILAWHSGWRHLNGESEVIGVMEEGQIIY